MSKRDESAADRIWKEKLDTCMSPAEAFTILMVAIVSIGLCLVVSS